MKDKYVNCVQKNGSRSVAVDESRFEIAHNITFVPLSTSLLPPLPAGDLRLLAVIRGVVDFDVRFELLVFEIAALHILHADLRDTEND